jgi:hypothetical protein
MLDPEGRRRDRRRGNLVREADPNVSPAASFVWGSPVQAGQLKPGNVLQFGGHDGTRTITTDLTLPPGSATGGRTDTRTPQELCGQPQHSAMVAAVVSMGVADVVEQNIPPVTGPVQTVRLVPIPRPGTETVTHETTRDGDIVPRVTVEETVRGAPRCHRPK